MKKLAPRASPFVCATLALALAAQTGAFAEDSPAIPEGLDPEMAALARISGLFDVEDPSSLYDFEINDSEVEFILDGSWEVAITSSLAMDFSSGETVYGYTPPVFTQTVDLVSWVLLDNTWYFEASFAEQFTRNTVAAGYIGNDDTVVKHVRVGNSGIVFPSDYPFITVGGGKAIAPGVMGTFAGDRWNADAIVRYDSSSQESLTLAGMNEVSDTFVSVSKPVRGKWFVLPDAPVTGSVTVYVESETGGIAGGGRRWRRLNQSEFIVSGLSGVIELVSATAGSVAVRYGSESYPGRTDFLTDANGFLGSCGIIAVDRPKYLGDTGSTVSLEGGTAVLVKSRGFFSPFEALMRYAVQGSEFELVHAESGVRNDDYVVSPTGTGYAELYPRSSGTDIRSFECRYPLASSFPLLYFPSAGGVQIDTDLSVRSRAFTPITSISLGNDVIAGTIQVTRNGMPESAFTFDESTGILELDVMPAAGDAIRVRWQKTDAAARNGTLTVAGGLKYRASDALSFSLANALRWNTSRDSYTDAVDGSPGSYIVSTGVDWNGSSLALSTAFAFDVSIPDTTGFYRVLGMDQKARTLYPARAWYSRPNAGINPELGEPFTTTPVTLAASDYAAPEGSDGDSMPTVSDSSVTGDVMAVRASLSGPASWTGADIAAGSKGDLDLSTAKEFSIAIKTVGPTADYELFLQLGVDADSSRDNADPLHPSVRTWKLDAPTEDSRWTVCTVTLSADDRRAIAAGNDIRIIARPVATAAFPVSVNLYTGPVEIVESGFGSESAEIECVEKTEPITVARPLSSVAPDIVDRFNSGINTVAELTIDKDASADHVAVTRTVPQMPLSSYRSLSFFMRLPMAPDYPAGSTITVSLDSPTLTAANTSCALVMHPDSLRDAQWHKVTVDLGDGNVSIDGENAAPSVASVTKLVGTGTPTRVAIAFDGLAPALPAPADGWKAWFDEFYLEDAVSSRTARNRTTVTWKKDGTLIGTSSLPILSDVMFSTTAETSASARSESDFDDPLFGATAETAFKLHRSAFTGSVKVSRETKGVLETESHSATIPLFFLTASEKYSTDRTEGSLGRSDSLAVSGLVAIETAFDASQAGPYMDRKTTISIVPSLPETDAGSFDLSATSAFSQSGKSPLGNISYDPWNEVWKESFLPLFSVGESDASRRAGATAVTFGWANDEHTIRGVTVDLKGDSAYSAGSLVTSKATLSYRISAPLDFGSFSLVPSWDRTASESSPADRGGSWLTDTTVVADSFRRMNWMFTTAPVADIVDPSLGKSISGNDSWSNEFSNQYALEWRRPSPGLISDLWTPSTVTARIRRETATDASADNVRDAWSAPVKAGFSALNMFGTRGALAIFDWYDEDELEQLYSWTPKWGPSYFVWSADAWHSVTLLFANTGTLSAENTVHYDSKSVSGTGRQFRDAVRVLWKRPGSDSPLLGPIERLAKRSVTVKREDSLTYSHSATDSGKENSMTVDHAMIAGIGNNAELKFTAGTGFAATDEGLTRLDFRLGISGKLTY